MKAYVGQTRAAVLIDELAGAGIGECVCRGEFPPRRSFSWFYDNGAFSDFKAGRPFAVAKFWRELALMVDVVELQGHTLPDFVVLPDLVAGGCASLTESASWLEVVRGYAARGVRFYVAVQDGMTAADVEGFLELAGDLVSGLFVGGSLPWKLETGAAWVTLAHARGLLCHVGRVGTAARVQWALRIGADSIDSSLPLWSSAKLGIFLEALRGRTRFGLQEVA
jgi:hypothetical protein